MFLHPVSLGSSFLGSSGFFAYLTISIPRPQSHDGSSMILCRFRYLFNRQWLVRSLTKFANCLRGRLPYSCVPVLNLCGRLIFRWCLAFVSPWFYIALIFVVMSAFIFVSWADFSLYCGWDCSSIGFIRAAFSLLRLVTHFQRRPCVLESLRLRTRGLIIVVVVLRDSWGYTVLSTVPGDSQSLWREQGGRHL